jgi:hypothetical protein
MMKAAHKFTASREEFIGLALSVWRGCDPDDLPLEGGIEVGKENEETQTNGSVHRGFRNRSCSPGESPLPKRFI